MILTGEIERGKFPKGPGLKTCQMTGGVRFAGQRKRLSGQWQDLSQSLLPINTKPEEIPATTTVYQQQLKLSSWQNLKKGQTLDLRGHLS